MDHTGPTHLILHDIKKVWMWWQLTPGDYISSKPVDMTHICLNSNQFLLIFNHFSNIPCILPSDWFIKIYVPTEFQHTHQIETTYYLANAKNELSKRPPPHFANCNIWWMDEIAVLGQIDVENYSISNKKQNERTSINIINVTARSILDWFWNSLNWS